MLTANTIANMRALVFTITGLVCFLYAFMVYATGNPMPMPFWVPGAFGLASALILILASSAAKRVQAKMAWDEGYKSDKNRAAQIGFWIALMLYPAFGLLSYVGIVNHTVVMPIMGTITGGAYLLLIVCFEIRGRA